MRTVLLSSLGAAAAVAGCIPVQIQAPAEPIEINLNVTIRQEVIVRLEGDARLPHFPIPCPSNRVRSNPEAGGLAALLRQAKFHHCEWG